MPIMLIDGNAVGRAASYAKPLIVDGKEVQAIYQTLNILRRVKAQYRDHKPFVLWDGRADFRFKLYPDYKSNRDATEKMAEASRKYKDQVPDIKKFLTSLGIDQAIAPSFEADDLAGFFSRKTNAKVLMITGDEDWIQLVNENVSWFDPRENRLKFVDHKNFQDYTGYKNGKDFLLAKAIQGDTSDAIKGLNGIGAKAAQALVNFGFKSFLADVRKAGIVSKDMLPPDLTRFAGVLDGHFCADKIDETIDLIHRNLMIMDLRSPLRDGQIKDDLILKRGKFDLDEFEYLCAELNFITIRRNLERWQKVFE